MFGDENNYSTQGVRQFYLDNPILIEKNFVTNSWIRLNL